MFTRVLPSLGLTLRGRREETAIEFIRSVCPQIPVPEVYGSRPLWEDGKDTEYIAMSKMPGAILRDAWATMVIEEKSSVLSELYEILKQLRQIPVPEERNNWRHRWIRSFCRLSRRTY